MMLAADFTEWMQVFRLRRAEEPIPCIATEGHDTRKPALEIAEAHCTQKCGQIATQGLHGGFTFLPGIDCRNEKNGGPRELGDDCLWNSRWHAWLLADLFRI